MKNFTTDIILNGQNSCLSEGMKKAIIKAGLHQYSKSELALYFECLVEVMNEKGAKGGENWTNELLHRLQDYIFPLWRRTPKEATYPGTIRTDSSDN